MSNAVVDGCHRHSSFEALLKNVHVVDHGSSVRDVARWLIILFNALRGSLATYGQVGEESQQSEQQLQCDVLHSKQDRL